MFIAVVNEGNLVVLFTCNPRWGSRRDIKLQMQRVNTVSFQETNSEELKPNFGTVFSDVYVNQYSVINTEGDIFVRIWIG
jgi:hypothetical protein